MDQNEMMIAPCGLFCMACPMFIAGQNEDVAKSLAKRLSTTPDKVVCSGCRPAEGSPVPLCGLQCSTYECAKEKGVFLCCDCSEFPCDKLSPAADRAGMLPHNMKIFSLLRIKRDGAESWASDYSRIMKRYFKGVMEIGKGPCMAKSEEDE